MISGQGLKDAQADLDKASAEETRTLLDPRKRGLEANIGLTQAGTVDTLTQAWARGRAVSISEAKLVLDQAESPEKVNQLKAHTEMLYENKKMSKVQRDEIIKQSDAKLKDLEKTTLAREAVTALNQATTAEVHPSAAADRYLKYSTAEGTETVADKYKRVMDVANAGARATMAAAGRKYQESDVKEMQKLINTWDGASDFTSLKPDVAERNMDTSTLAVDLYAQGMRRDLAASKARSTMVVAYDLLSRLEGIPKSSDLYGIIGAGVTTSVVLKKLIENGMKKDEARNLIKLTILELQNANKR